MLERENLSKRKNYCTLNEMIYLKTNIASCYGKVNSRELAVTYKIIVALFQLIRSTVQSN